MKEWGISINIYTYNLAPSVVAKDPWVTGSHQHGTRHQPCLPKPKVTLEFSDWRAAFLQRIRMENVMYQVHRSPLGIGLNCWLTQRFVPRFIFLPFFSSKKVQWELKKEKEKPSAVVLLRWLESSKVFAGSQESYLCGKLIRNLPGNDDDPTPPKRGASKKKSCRQDFDNNNKPNSLDGKGHKNRIPGLQLKTSV